MSGVNNSIYIQISALVYCILLIIIYFGRKQYKSFENRIYSSLIIVNFVGLIIDITLGFVSAKYLQYQVLTTILTKLYLLYFVTWIGCFTYYIITISSKDKSYKKLEKDKIYLVLFVLTLIIIYVLPVKFSQSEKGIHSYGYGTTLAYIVSTIAIIICVSTFVKNYKIKKSKKYLPVLIFMFMGTMLH